MTRFLSAILLSLFLLGTVGFCQYSLTHELHVRVTPEADHHGHDHALSREGGAFMLRITPAFDVSKDPFSIRRADDAEIARIRVSHEGENLVYWTNDVKRGKTIEVRDVRLPEERVELLIEATPDPVAARMLCALRVEILREGTVFADQTLWSAGGGAPIQRRVDMKLKPALRTLDRGLSVPES
jgi:hypothetical protein